MKRYPTAIVLAALLLFAACNKETPKVSEANTLKEIGARIEQFTVKSIANPTSGKIRFEEGDAILLDNGSALSTYVWNASINAFVPATTALQASDSYKAAFPASAARTSTPGKLVIDAPASVNLEGAYLKDLPMLAEYKDKMLVFSACADVIGPKPYAQQGSGTEADPFIVAQWEDIRTLVENASDDRYIDAFYKQTADIELPYDFRFSQIPVFRGNYDGGGHAIRGAVLKNTSIGAPAGFFGLLDGATVKNLTLDEIHFTSNQLFLGGIAGKAVNATVENCTVSGYMKSTAQFTWEGWSKITTDAQNHGFTGGIIGFASATSIKGCTFSGQLSSFGKHTGCIAGYITDESIIENCTAEKGAEAYSGYHCAGGIVGSISGKSAVTACRSLAAVSSTGYWVGGIAGYLQDGRIENCVTSSASLVSCRQFSVGGIVGGILPQSGQETAVKSCIAYCDVQGQYNVGGIAGTVDVQSGTQTSISGCAYIGGNLYATGTNSYKYNLTGGIVGYVLSRDEVKIEDCASLPSLLKASIQNAQKGSDAATCIGGVGGILGYQSQNATTTIRNCYSNLEKSRILVCYQSMDSFASSFIHYGALYGGGGAGLSIENCFRDNSFACYSKSTTDASTGISVAAFTDGTLLSSLGSNWVASASGYPLPRGLAADPSPRKESAKRVSVIGDSISTFAGYIPAGYNYHYPCSDGSVTQVSQTYWYQLIYDQMKNAVLDLNMSYSGSAVTRSTNTSKSGNHWYENCYIQRYLRQGGVGNPDIVLLHGGTNDWAHNDCPLYPGGKTCHDELAPAEDVYTSVFATADAAEGYDAVAALPDTDFLSAYVKMLKLLKTQYPQVKIVCIVGDYLSEGIEACITEAAQHYGAKVVNLLRVNGFNDQTYMPKHDYNGSGGCHPDARAMTFISNKIYAELGPWLDN